MGKGKDPEPDPDPDPYGTFDKWIRIRVALNMRIRIPNNVFMNIPKAICVLNTEIRKIYFLS
jgi:hypothetical protein